MPLELYQFLPSPPCIMVRLLGEHLNIEMDIKEVDVLKGEHLKEEFLQINPVHIIPTLVDEGFVLCESRAILMYIINKYGTDDDAISLYPMEPNERAVVDMRLCYDLSTLYARMTDAFFPVLFHKQPLDSAKVDRLNQALEMVNSFLGDGFVAGSKLSIADFSTATILKVIDSCGHDLSGYSDIPSYLERCSGLLAGWNDIVVAGADIFGNLFKEALEQAEA